MSSLSEQANQLLGLIPETGSIGNVTLRRNFNIGNGELGSDETGAMVYFDAAKKELLAAGLIKLGRGKGGSVKRVSPVSEQLPAVESGSVSVFNADPKDFPNTMIQEEF